MLREGLGEDFYKRMKPRLHKRIGCELRLARHVLDFGCGSCDLVRYLAATCRQEVTGVDVVSDDFPKHLLEETGFSDIRVRLIERGQVIWACAYQPMIGMTLCKIVSVKDNVIEIDRIDAFADTPVLDIKPHVPRFDAASDATIPWWLKKKGSRWG